MELGDSSKKSRFSSYERVAAISLVVLAVAFPLYIDHRPESELEDEEVGWGLRIKCQMLLVIVHGWNHPDAGKVEVVRGNEEAVEQNQAGVRFEERARGAELSARKG
ncbi:hypothetical protein JHK82_043768 [Glycine max]|nr:hypothetical protein JHK82_043768 [Glycine max]